MTNGRSAVNMLPRRYGPSRSLDPEPSLSQGQEQQRIGRAWRIRRAAAGVISQHTFICSAGKRHAAQCCRRRCAQPVQQLVRAAPPEWQEILRKLGAQISLLVLDGCWFPRWRRTDPKRPNIFAALEEQLGLKLAPARGPVEALIIDHAERPAAD